MEGAEKKIFEEMITEMFPSWMKTKLTDPMSPKAKNLKKTALRCIIIKIPHHDRL